MDYLAPLAIEHDCLELCEVLEAFDWLMDLACRVFFNDGADY